MIINSVEISDQQLRAIADLLVEYYNGEIGELMRQAEHWARPEHHFPLAVHHRVIGADNYYQSVALFELFRRQNTNPFKEIIKALNRGRGVFPPGRYPPSAEIYRYGDPRFVVEALKTALREAGGPGAPP